MNYSAPSFSQLDVDVGQLEDNLVDDLFFDDVDFHLVVVVFVVVVSDCHAAVEDFDQPPPKAVANVDLIPQTPLETSRFSFAFTKVSLCTDGE